MTDITIREAACPHDPLLFWDTVWNAAEGEGAWALSGPSELGNRGGLAAVNPLATSVINLLFTDRRCPPDHPLAKRAEGDLRGWWGDGVIAPGDADQKPLGSLLWLVTERGTATPEDARWAEAFATEALQPLIDCGAVASVKCVAQAWPARNAMTLDVELYGRDGTRVWSQRFDPLWRR